MKKRLSIKENFCGYMKNTKVSTHIYRSVLIAIILIGIAATLIIYRYLDNLFMHYEASRPKYLAEEYFNEIFDDDDYQHLYTAAGLEGSLISREEFNRWFKQFIENKTVSYGETSDALSGNSKYIIYLDNTKIGEFLLIPSGKKNQGGFDILEKGAVTVSFTDQNAYSIRVRKGSSVTVNGFTLSDDYITESGKLITGEYHVYTVRFLIDTPKIEVKYDDTPCYLIKAENNDRVYMDEVLNDPVSAGIVTTIRAIKGHTVYADGKLLDSSSVIQNASGEFEGYFHSLDRLEYVVYSYSGDVTSVVIKDQDGKERDVKKIPGGNIYTDTAIGISGTIQFMALSDSIPTLDGIQIDSKYIVEKDIPTESCKYMYGTVKGITYNKYIINWVGDEPTLEITNKYKNTATLKSTDGGIPTEVIQYDEKGLADHSKLITDASHTYVKMMANDASESSTLRYFDPSADIYALVRDNPQGYFTKHDSYEFIDSIVKDVYVYDEKTFSGTISFVFTVTRNGKVTEYPFNYTFYFRLVGEKYLIYEMINNGTQQNI